MPMRVYSEDIIRKRKLFTTEEKPPRKYTKSIKEEIKKEPLDLSDNDDIDGDDVMDIEEADSLPKKGKQATGNKKRMVKKKNIKKIVKNERDNKEPKEKGKPKRKKKIPQQQSQQPIQDLIPPDNLMQAPASVVSNNDVKSNNVPVEPSKPTKKVIKVTKEKKTKPKVQKTNTKKTEETTKAAASQNESDTDSPEESDAYETCGVANCQRPSGRVSIILIISNIH